MRDQRRNIQESLLANLEYFYSSNPLAQTFMATNISTPQDMATFATINNIQINYEAPNMELLTEGDL
jgi:hypothetical protein